MKAKFNSRTSWREKFERPQEPRIVTIPPKMARSGENTMLIPTPKLVDELIRKVPKGRIVTVGELRRKLAADFTVDVACPLTTGIFVRIVAETAEEDRANGRKRLTPYWRVVKDDGSLNPKFPGGPKRQAEYLRGEHFTLTRNGTKPPRIRDFEDKLYRLN
jgi:alkylated DNA nucleotide flippase Atl1